MVSTHQPSQAEQVASNARPWADGGFIFADAPSAVTSAVAIVLQVSTRRNIAPLRVTRSSRASSRASGGFTTIALKSSSPVRSFTLLTRVRWINRRPDRTERCPQIGKRCSTNRKRLFGATPSHAVRSWRRKAAAWESDRLERVLSELEAAMTGGFKSSAGSQLPRQGSKPASN
jgi:hypothetical protein